MLEEGSNIIKKFLDEPHEKIYLNMILIIIFSFIYYQVYLYDGKSYMINEELLKEKDGKLDSHLRHEDVQMMNQEYDLHYGM